MLLARVYRELRLIARTKSTSLGASPTSLANEVVVRLLASPNTPSDQTSIIRLACGIMNNLNVDGVRASAARRRREQTPRRHDGHESVSDESRRRLIKQLETLHELDPKAAEVIWLSALCRMNQQRIAESLGMSVRSVQRKLKFARAWLGGDVTEG